MLYSKSLFKDKDGKSLRCFVVEGGSKEVIVALLTQGGAKISRTMTELKDRRRQHLLIAHINYKVDKQVTEWGWLPIDLEWVVRSCSSNCAEDLHKYRLGTRHRYSMSFDSDRRRLFGQLIREGVMKLDEDDDSSVNSVEAVVGSEVPIATSTQTVAGSSIWTSQSESQQAQSSLDQFKFDRRHKDRPPAGRKKFAAGAKITSQQGFRMLVQQNESALLATAAVTSLGECLPAVERLSNEELANERIAAAHPVNEMCTISKEAQEPVNEQRVSAPPVNETRTNAMEQPAPAKKSSSSAVSEVVSLRYARAPLSPHLLVDSATSPTYPWDEDVTMPFFARRGSTWKVSKPFRNAGIRFTTKHCSSRPAESRIEPSPDRTEPLRERAERQTTGFADDGQVAGCSRDTTVPVVLQGKRTAQPVTDATGSEKRKRLTCEIVEVSSSEDEATRIPRTLSAARRIETHDETSAQRPETSPRKTGTSSRGLEIRAQLTQEPTARSNQSSRRPMKKGLYDWAEKRAILEFIVRSRGYHRTKGVALWEEMEAARVCPIRSSQSMKEHFRKQLAPNINGIPFLTDQQKHMFKKFRDYDYRAKGTPLSLASSTVRDHFRISPLTVPSDSSSESPTPPRRCRSRDGVARKPAAMQAPAQLRQGPAEPVAIQAAASGSKLPANVSGIRRLFRQRSLTPAPSPTQQRHTRAQPAPAPSVVQPVASAAPDSASAAPEPTSPAVSAAAAISKEIERCFLDAVAQPSPLRPYKRIVRRPESSDEEDALRPSAVAAAAREAAVAAATREAAVAAATREAAVAAATREAAVAAANDVAIDTVAPAAVVGEHGGAAEPTLAAGVVETKAYGAGTAAEPRAKSANFLAAVVSPMQPMEGSSDDFVENSPISAASLLLSKSRTPKLSERLAKIRRSLRMSSLKSPRGTACNESINAAEQRIGILPPRQEISPLREGREPRRKETTPLREGREPLSKETTPLREGREPLSKETTPLRERREPLSKETTPLREGREPLSKETTPLREGREPLSKETTPLREEREPLRKETTPFWEKINPLREERGRTTPLTEESPLLGDQTPPVTVNASAIGFVLETSGDSTDAEGEFGTVAKQDHVLDTEVLIRKLEEFQSQRAETQKSPTTSKQPLSETKDVSADLQQPLLGEKKLLREVKVLLTRVKVPIESRCGKVAGESVGIAVGAKSDVLEAARPGRSVAPTGPCAATGPAEQGIAEEAGLLTGSAVTAGLPSQNDERQTVVSSASKIRVRSLQELQELQHSKDLLCNKDGVLVKTERSGERHASTSDRCSVNSDGTVSVVDLDSDDEYSGDLMLQEAARRNFVKSIQQTLGVPLIEVTPDRSLSLNVVGTTPELTGGRSSRAVSARCPVCGWLALHEDVKYHNKRASLAFCPSCPKDGDGGGPILDLLFWLELAVAVGDQVVGVIAAGPVAEQLFCCSPREFLFVEASRDLLLAKLWSSLRFHGTLLVAARKPVASGPSRKLPLRGPASRKNRTGLQTLSSSTAKSSRQSDPPIESGEDADVVVFLGRMLAQT